MHRYGESQKSPIGIDYSI